MKSGLMFGDLLLYEDKDYGMSHNIICFDSLYEKREYELIAVFYSQVFYKWENVFKYYNFFQADTQEAFDDWYRNIKELSLYDTGVTAEFGDEFITLSCCAYHVDDGRFVVVGKRR
jgi:sortase B